MKISLFKYLSASILLSSLTFIFIFILNIMIIRELDPLKYGIIVLAISIIDILLVFLSFSLNLSVIKFQQQGKIYYSHLVSFAWILFLIMSVFLNLTSYYILPYFEIDKIVISYILLMLPFSALAVPSSVYNAALNRDFFFFKSTFLSSLPLVIANIVGLILVYNDFGIKSLLIRHIISSSLFFLLVFDYNFKLLFKFDSQIFKNIFNFNIKLLFNRISEVFVSKIPIVLISNIFGLRSVSIFERSLFLNDIVNRFLSPLYNQINFSYFGKFNKNISYLESILHITYVFSIYSSLIIISIYSCFSKEIILLLFGNNWLELANVIVLLKFYLIGTIIIAPITYLLISLDKVNILTTKNIIILSFSLIIIIIFEDNFDNFVQLFSKLYFISAILLSFYSFFYLKINFVKIIFLPIPYFFLDGFINNTNIENITKFIAYLLFLILYFFSFDFVKLKNNLKLLPVKDMLPK